MERRRFTGPGTKTYNAGLDNDPRLRQAQVRSSRSTSTPTTSSAGEIGNSVTAYNNLAFRIYPAGNSS
ncbi:hypothetical protein [Nonomuraea dietziae]|uniref:hypothetical protein n=1 Tax=Nonomuraea dietziae TaxID=65515 RepID=UPI0031E0657C